MATLLTSELVAPRTRRFLTVDVAAAASGGTQLLKLRVQRLPVGRGAGVADEAFSGSVSVISYGNRNPLISKEQGNLPKILQTV